MYIVHLFTIKYDEYVELVLTHVFLMFQELHSQCGLWDTEPFLVFSTTRSSAGERMRQIIETE
jgi:hypothetical protein